MKLLLLAAISLAATSSVDAQGKEPFYRTISPLPYTGRAGSVSVYSRETNRITCMARGTGATWLGTRLGIKRVDRATGTVRIYGLGDGLPWGAVQSIATDDSGSSAVALVYNPTGDQGGTLSFCLYNPRNDRWQVLSQLPYQPADWFAEMEYYTRSHFRTYPPNYHIAVGEKYAVLVPYISTQTNPLVSRYDRTTGAAAGTVVAPIIAVGDTAFLATRSAARYGETLYLGTQRGLYAVAMNTGNTVRYFPKLEVLKVAVPLSQTDTTDPTLWLTAVPRTPAMQYGSEEYESGFLQAFSLLANKPLGEPISLKSVGDIGTWRGVLRVGEDGFPYLVRTDRFARYEKTSGSWRYFDTDGKETTAEEIWKRFRSGPYGLTKPVLAPATVIPDTIASERATVDVQGDGSPYYDAEPFRWTQVRFPQWLTPDARDPFALAVSPECRELAALPVSGELFANRASDPSIPHREWSVQTRDGIPQLWKWDTTPANQQMPQRMTLGEQFVWETQSDRRKESVMSMTPPEPVSKIPLNLPPLHRETPAITGLHTVWQGNIRNDFWDTVIAETSRGTLWLSRVGSQGEAQTGWLPPTRQKALESIDQKPFLDIRPFPTDAPALPIPAPVSQPPVLRALKNNGGSASFYVIAAGSPYLWWYDNFEKTWKQKAKLPASQQRFLTADGKNLDKVCTAIINDRLLIGGADGLWVYDGTDNRDQWIPVKIPPKMAPADAATVAGSDLRLQWVAADKQNLFIAGLGEKNDDPPILIRWNKKSAESMFLVEGEYGIPSLRGGTPLLMSDGEAVWCALQPRNGIADDENDIRGGYRWEEKMNRFTAVTDEPVVAMEPNVDGERDVYLLTRNALVQWHRKTNTTTRFAVPAGQTTKSMLQTARTIYVATQSHVYAWNKKSGEWRLLAEVPRLSKGIRLQLVQDKALWLYDGSSMVRIAL